MQAGEYLQPETSLKQNYMRMSDTLMVSLHLLSELNPQHLSMTPEGFVNTLNSLLRGLYFCNYFTHEQLKCK